MKRLILYILYLLALWFVLFFINRVFFVLYQLPIGNKISNEADLYRAFYKGYPLDLATATIFILLPMMGGIIYYIIRKKIIRKITLVLMMVFLTVYVSVSLADAGLYKEWNAKINMQALEHFQNPSEVFKTLSTKLLFLFILFLSCMVLPFYWVYKKKIHTLLFSEQNEKISKRILPGVLFFLISVTLGVFAIRGGITNIPINQSIAYFSNDALANDIAVNPFYNLIQDLDIKSKLPDTRVYKLRSNEEAQQMIAADFAIAKDTGISVLNTTRPNLVFIFLESWSADNISVLGGIEGCTPQFNKLCNEGLLFTKAYADAYVSDQGIPAILSAYPSAYRLAIINQPIKVHNLPCISEELIPLGYRCSFLFGGELVYGNLRGYLLEKKFSELLEVYDLKKYPAGKLGVQDEYTFRELLTVLNQKRYPFLQGYFSLSSHMPYDFNSTDGWKSEKDDPEKLYTESVHYADLHMGKFFEEAKKQTWYDSTLFVVVADHSHNSIKQWDAMSAERQHIPMLFLGGALKEEWRGKRWERVVSQLDVVSTLYHQMGIESNRYPWSRNMLNPYTPSSAFYVFYGGAGYVNDSGYAASYYHNLKYIKHNLSDTNLALPYQIKALSFQQLVFEDVRLRK